ncbi:phosphoribosylamine--glycine ligase [Erysipelatoclostridium sp. AM42-17]|uniref:phosphoribosylamine--glycine ligase n=1 Tax=Erysipelatoclostridium sp. AM42-17 TaxID=2293102 RepID=UPI000E4B24A9|nr:phosphoribosylamine--glycine ligase [Erysipelatoclostridium sp. AM42-17]RHS96266.1 phosphoribosylamine--glycine ligase [Erysipelatoclostridium sp. AM42-17]
MKVLVIGSGGREHAIAYKLNQSPQVDQIYAIPGNPGIAQIGTCVDGSVEDNDMIVSFVKEHQIDLTVIGPEVPLCNGLADDLEAAGFLAFGPTRHAATLEGSKAFSKDFMIRHHIPTARYVEVTDYQDAVNQIDHFDFPLVIKADGLAAGKGVVIVDNKDDAIKTLKEMMVDGALDGAGSKVVLEEFLTGFECSLLCFTDGKTIVPMVSAKDHKQIFDGNKGPNTGGMGTVSPNPFMPDNMDEVLKETVLDPFMKGLKEDHMDYRGVVFIGLMIENGQAKVLEFNVRFGDPETQSILLRLDSDLYEIMVACAKRELDQVEVKWSNNHVACLVLASGGYPGKYEKGIEISHVEDVADDIVVFHAGTALKDGKLVTNGGRVLNICAKGQSLKEALDKVYQAANIIDFDGKYYRKDIGLR